MKNNINNNILLKDGFVDAYIDPKLDLVNEINVLKKQKNAIILAHYYQEGEIQDIADFVGDSLYLSQQAAKTNADIVAFCGVHFMAETVKILKPDIKVLLPDLNAGCSLADSCKYADFKKFKENYLGHTVVSYINTSAEIKSLTDIVCTSSNAVKIIESLPKNEKIIFGPDRNLGKYIQSITGRDMIIWDGACHVHEKFSLEEIIRLKKENPDARILAHPECHKEILIVADFVGSTGAMLKFAVKDTGKKYIVATEPGIIHMMQKKCTDKVFIPAPPKDSTCGCNNCSFMKLNTMKKLYNCLKFELPEIHVDEIIRAKAQLSIKRMLDISEKLGIE
jgi:quinolinate synthase